ncbi:MAG TPA: folate-binding protein [Marinobacter sp.]|nr:folate-binding protein [Marinobacter sp.]
MSDTTTCPPVDSPTAPSITNVTAEQPLPENSWTELSDRLLVTVSGAGTEKFLQGQFSQNVSEVTAGKSLHAAASNRKGRAYALVRMVRHNDDIIMDFSRELAETTEAELRKYLMLFRGTTMTHLENGKIIGIFGKELAQAVAGEQVPIATLQHPGDTLSTGHGYLILLEPSIEGPERYELWSPSGTLPAVLEAHRQCSLATWQAGQIAAGVPWLTSATAGTYVPQMLNWQHLGGVHFKKGCYTGQEIIARMHFLGQLKKSLYRLAVTADAEPAIGCAISNGERNVGEVVNTLQTGLQQYHLLAVIRHDAANGPLTLADGASANVQLCPLPYAVPEREQP